MSKLINKNGGRQAFSLDINHTIFFCDVPCLGDYMFRRRSSLRVRATFYKVTRTLMNREQHLLKCELYDFLTFTDGIHGF